MEEVSEIYDLVERYARHRLATYEQRDPRRPFKIELMKEFVGMPNRAKELASGDADTFMVEQACTVWRSHQSVRSEIYEALTWRHRAQALQTDKTMLLRDLDRKLEKRRHG